MAVLATAQNVPYGADASRVYFGTDTHAMGVLLGAGAGALVCWAEREGWVQRFRHLLDIGGGGGLAAAWRAMTHTRGFVPAPYPGGFPVFAGLAGVAVA